MKSFLFCIVIFIASSVFAQNTSLKAKDSILQNFELAYESATTDSTRLKSLINLSRYFVLRETKQSLEKLEEAQRLFNSVTGEKDSTDIGEIYRLYAMAYRRLGNISEALSYNHKAIDVFIQLKDTFKLGHINQNLAVLHRSLNDNEKSIFYGKKAINQNLSIGRLKGLGYNYNNIAQAFMSLKKEDSAAKYFIKARDCFSEINSISGVTRVNASYAKFFYNRGQYQEALALYLEALTLSETINYKQDILAWSILISKTYIGLKDYKNAEKYIENALVIAEKENFIQFLSEVYKVRAEILELTNRYKEAYKNISLYYKYNDSILNLENVKKIQEIGLTYEFRKEKVRDSLILVKEQEVAETEIDLLEAENKLSKQWMLFGGIVLFALFSIIYLVRSRRFAKSKQELQEQFTQNLINEQEKERTRIARELHDSVGQKLMLLSKTTKSSGDENAEDLAKNTLEEVRSISRGLHPSNLERLGLTESINALVYNINANTDLFFTEEIDNIDGMLPRESELHVYRIIQESLTNIIKHSEAKAVKMVIDKTTSSIKIMVRDNGKGFDIKTKNRTLSLGLNTLFERTKIIDAKMVLDSQIGKGTTLQLNIPII